jgi:hypothetical protein
MCKRLAGTGSSDPPGHRRWQARLTPARRLVRVGGASSPLSADRLERSKISHY